MQKTLIASAMSLTLMTGQALATPIPGGDARTFAMGGTGTASAHPMAATMMNPALMALPQPESRDKFGLALHFQANVAYDDDLIDDIDTFQNSQVWNDLDQAISSFNSLNNGSPTPAQITNALDQVIAAGNEADRLLTQIDREALRANLNGAFALAIPRQGLSFGFFADTGIEVSGIARYEDSALISGILNTATQIRNGSLPNSTDLSTLNTTPQSNGEALALAVTEVGVALAMPVQIAGQPVYVGVSPKVLSIRTFDYKADVNSFDDADFDAGTYEKNTSTFNLDAGVAHQYGENKDLTVGFTVKNLIPKDVETIGGKKVSIDPIARLGVALNRATYTLTGDLELTKTKRAGFEGDKQYLRLGAEWAPLSWFALRGGMAHNLASDNAESTVIASNTLYTAGIGLSAAGIGLDLTGAVSDNDVGGSLQLSAVY
ncbi:MAG: hypothetical protein D6758_01100 [Gammaproteobacteria bacterium]|nr:MAG: hypothetical protein D6758_01100 [Gammaproteobacteria bacterium]